MGKQKKQESRTTEELRSPKPKTNKFGLKVRELSPPHEIFIPQRPVETVVPFGASDATGAGSRPIGEQPGASTDPRSVPERRSASERRSQSEPRSKTQSTAVQIERGSVSERRSDTERRSPRISVEFVDGFLQVPNYIADRLLPLLTQDEATVYFRLYRLSFGHGRDWCVVGAPRLIETTGIKRTSVFAALKGLESKGLILRLAQEVRRGESGGRGSEGNRYQVFEPEVIGRSASERRSVSERRSDAEPRSPGGRMKEHERKIHESAPFAVAPATNYQDESAIGTDRRIIALTKMVTTFKASHPDATPNDVRNRVKQMVDHEQWSDIDVDEVVNALGAN